VHYYEFCITLSLYIYFDFDIYDYRTADFVVGNKYDKLPPRETTGNKNGEMQLEPVMYELFDELHGIIYGKERYEFIFYLQVCLNYILIA
jgi:hypothetical protein